MTVDLEGAWLCSPKAERGEYLTLAWQCADQKTRFAFLVAHAGELDDAWYEGTREPLLGAFKPPVEPMFWSSYQNALARRLNTIEKEHPERREELRQLRLAFGISPKFRRGMWPKEPKALRYR
jgi:hypothetical protein